VEVTRSPLLGEHTVEILRDVLGYDGEALEQVIASGAVGEPRAKAAE
ncbi:MAG: formyl-CoA transferase, partial [Pseudomonadota bacterium]